VKGLQKRVVTIKQGKKDLLNKNIRVPAWLGTGKCNVVRVNRRVKGTTQPHGVGGRGGKGAERRGPVAGPKSDKSFRLREPR